MYIVTYRQKGKKLRGGEGGMMSREINLTYACKVAMRLEKEGYVILNIIRVGD
jgi:hypothetical protein